MQRRRDRGGGFEMKDARCRSGSFRFGILDLLNLCASAPLREIFFVLVFAIWAIVPNVTAGNWDRFRGPNGAGQSDDTSIPTKWEPANFLWKQPLPGVGHSSPVIWQNRLFITSGDPKTGAQIVSAFDARDGSRIWEQRFDA